MKIKWEHYDILVSFQKQRKMQGASSEKKTANWNCNIWSNKCVRRHVVEGRRRKFNEEEENTNSYLMTLRTRQNT
jgi:hypothetical protein